jgi:hypothetical protein
VLDPDSDSDFDPELDPEPMCGQWWPDGVVVFGAGVVLDGVGGVVVVLGVDWVGVVPVAVLDPLGAAAAPAMPATAPPVASAPTTRTALMVLALLMRTSCGREGSSLRQPVCEPPLSGPQRAAKPRRRSV